MARRGATLGGPSDVPFFFFHPISKQCPENQRLPLMLSELETPAEPPGYRNYISALFCCVLSRGESPPYPFSNLPLETKEPLRPSADMWLCQGTAAGQRSA